MARLAVLFNALHVIRSIAYHSKSVYTRTNFREKEDSMEDSREAIKQQLDTLFKSRYHG